MFGRQTPQPGALVSGENVEGRACGTENFVTVEDHLILVQAEFPALSGQALGDIGVTGARRRLVIAAGVHLGSVELLGQRRNQAACRAVQDV